MKEVASGVTCASYLAQNNAKTWENTKVMILAHQV
jgi:hypothetical protein